MRMQIEDFYAHTLQALRTGGVAVYPTETLYALGCNGFDGRAAKRVAQIKDRPESKPLPLIIGERRMLDVVAALTPAVVADLTDIFWPGPLSILVRAVSSVAMPVCDANGMVSVRQTPHPMATSLSCELGVPLVATSANFSGGVAPSEPENLDPSLVAQVDAALLTPPYPAGGKPSTLVLPLEDGTLEILREGAVSLEQLRAKEFKVKRHGE